ncbi:nidogen-2 isoform X1 [Amia ocellicauda]|uniref:nidogen-2 isoform X1 n=1 Tax=Amia ocellicauda TaxID=2972642 RepID=UPI003463D3E4
MKMLAQVTALLLGAACSVCAVAALHRRDLFPHGPQRGDLTLQQGDDETSAVLRLRQPLYFYDTKYSDLYVATNGIISTQDLPRETQYVDDGFPTDFPVIAPFLADIDTSKGKGAISYRVDESPSVLLRAAEEVKRGFPRRAFTPTHAVIATWENVGPYEELSPNAGPSNRVNTFQAVLAYDERDTYALFLYPEDGLQFFGTRPKESYNVQLELPARVGFSKGEVPFMLISRIEGPYYSVTSTEQTVKNLYQTGNSGVPGLWIFHVGSSFSLDNVVPAEVGGLSVVGASVATLDSNPNGPSETDADYPDEDYPDEDYEDQSELEYPTTDIPDLDQKEPAFPLPAFPETQEPGRGASIQPPPYSEPEEEPGHLRPEFSNRDHPEPSRPQILATRAPEPRPSGPREHPLPQPRNSPPEDASQPQPFQPDHTELEVLSVYPLGEVVPILESSPPLSRGHVVSVDEDVNFDTGVIEYSTDNKETCARFQQQCSQHGRCVDYSSGFCCHCQSSYYGNGRHCLPDGAPHRVNGKVSGRISVGATPVDLDGVDLHAYVVVSDGRAYTAISQVPEPLGWALMPVFTIGGLFGWLFALELPGHKNGFGVTGAEFTRHAEVTFHPGNQRLSIVQTAQGLDSQNYLAVDARIHGDIPFVPPGATLQIEPYTETYHYHPSVVTSSSEHQYKVLSMDRGSESFSYQLRQNISYRDCRHGPRNTQDTQRLSVERVFVIYIKEERILRYAVTNKIGTPGEPTPVTENPCYKGNHECDTTAQCLPGEGMQYRCQCATGYRGDGRSCSDIDECAEGLSSCGSQALCVNLQGSHRCECKAGYEFGFDGHTCIVVPEHPKTQCEHHRDSLQGGLSPRGPRPHVGAYLPQCDEEGNYRPLQCHGSTGHCWCVDSRGQERVGTRTTPGTTPTNCEQPVAPERPKTQCEHHRDSLQGGLGPRGHRPNEGAYLPQCDEEGNYRPLQCHGSTGHCWCVDSRGQERAGTRTPPSTPPTNCDQPVAPERPKTQCEHHRDSLQGGPQPNLSAYLPQCDEEGNYRPLQCHGSTGHCWCVDSRGQEQAGTRTTPGKPPTNCDQPVAPERTKTQCEHHRDSLQRGLEPRGHRPNEGAYLPQCDEEGNYRPLQCHGSTGHCWCVDSRGQERVGTRTPPGTPPTNCDQPVAPERPKTQCEHHRDSLQGGLGPRGARPSVGTYVPQCDEEGNYRPLQCHGSTGHCWCVDSRGQEQAGTRTPPGTTPTNCDQPVVPTQRPDTVCERWRASLVAQYGDQPAGNHYLPQCDELGQFNPLQCYGDSSYCWCVDKDGREVPGSRSQDSVKPACIPTVAPPTMRPTPRPDVTPLPPGTSLLYAQGQQIGALPLNGTTMDKDRATVLLALHGSIVVGIDYDCREKKVYWTDLAGRTISRASLEPGAEPEIVINTGLLSPEGLAVDSLRRRMFWVDSGPDKIEMSNLDGTGRRVLFDTELVNPRAIVVDSFRGNLYWTDWNREAPKIETCTVEGRNRRILVKDGIGLPNALTFDTITNELCWADAGTKRLECIAPDGTGRRVIYHSLNYPFSLVSYSNHFFYTDWRRDGVISLNRDTDEIREYLPDQRSHLYGITVAYPHCISGTVPALFIYFLSPHILKPMLYTDIYMSKR